jgi:hypothetical protein
LERKRGHEQRGQLRDDNGLSQGKIGGKVVFSKSERRGQMGKKFSAVAGLMIALCSVFVLMSIAGNDARTGLAPIPEPDRVAALIPYRALGDFCEISNDDGTPVYQYAAFDSGMGFAVYMDPARCVSNPYPFQVTDAHFTLFGPLAADWIWPVEIQVNIRDVSGGDKCSGPGALLSGETFSLPSDSGYPQMMNLTLSQPWCVTGPFFMEVMYLSRRDASQLPSLVMDEAVAAGPDTCDSWFLNTDGYESWVDHWGPGPPGDAIIRATGYTDADVCDSSWYFKPDTTNAPSGMPDFSQYQFGDSTALCAPAAVANCLWWFDAVPAEYQEDPVGFIRLLAGYFHTHPDSGTCVDSIKSGLNRYCQEQGFAVWESTYVQPDFYEMEDSLKACQDVILLLGFWQLDKVWERVGGHFVTMAGVCSESTKVALSDPARDAAEGGWPGRLRPEEHPPHPVGDTLHNDPQFVSQDMYWALIEPHIGGEWRLVFYEDFEEIGAFEGQNFQPGQHEHSVSYNPQLPIYPEVEYAVMICPRSTAVEEEEESNLPGDFRLFQNHPNPFNAETQIKYDLKRTCQVTLSIYNVLGERVVILVQEKQGVGFKTVTWDGKDQKGKALASGLYFYELRAGESRQTKRMVLLK